MKDSVGTRPRHKVNKVLLRTVIPPILIALISASHPAFSTNASDSLARIKSAPLWEVTHIALLLAVLAFDASLLQWRPLPIGKLSVVRRLAVLVNAGFYAAFIGIDGLASTVLSHLAPTNAAQAAITSLFASPLVGALGWIGGAGWIIAAIAIITQRHQSGLSSGPAWFLLIGTVWLTASHAPPLGVIAGALIAIGASWASLSKQSS